MHCYYRQLFVRVVAFFSYINLKVIKIMCWVNNKCTKHVATKDIPIFKLVNKVTAQYCVSLVTLFKYQYEQLYTLDSEIMVEEVYTYYFIYEGFHSYGMNKFAHYKKSAQQLVKGIIPKGATYYYNSYLKEYVSNQIILHKPSIICA